MNVTLIASTRLHVDALAAATGGFTRGPDPSTDTELLIEASGRSCYQSWDRPNPATARTRDYVRKNIIGKDHGSVLEHASATFYITGVSRALTHELIRHRHLSFSELSQRYVDVGDIHFVTPPAVQSNARVPIHEGGGRGEWDVGVEFEGSVDGAQDAYIWLASALGRVLPRKQAREAARAVMPNATETRIVVTGNYRAWRHVIRVRGSEHADAEIRELTIKILELLYDEAPSVFGDFSIVELPDGRRVVE